MGLCINYIIGLLPIFVALFGVYFHGNAPQVYFKFMNKQKNIVNLTV